MNIDDNFRSLVVGEHKVVDVVIENGNIVYTWSPQWDAWSDLQHSEELQLLKDRAAAVLSKGGKGEGQSKSKSKSHGHGPHRDISVRVAKIMLHQSRTL